MGQSIGIQAFKYPNIRHYEWQAELLEQTEDYVWIYCRPGRQFIHHTKNQVFTFDNTTVELFSLKEWYTVAMVIEEGKVVSYYCNIAMPSVLQDDTLTFIDLDLDLFKPKDGDWVVLDEEEFEANSIKYEYPPELKDAALRALDALKEKVLTGSFPFDGSVDKLIDGLKLCKQ